MPYRISAPSSTLYWNIAMLGLALLSFGYSLFILVSNEIVTKQPTVAAIILPTLLLGIVIPYYFFLRWWTSRNNFIVEFHDHHFEFYGYAEKYKQLQEVAYHDLSKVEGYRHTKYMDGLLLHCCDSRKIKMPIGRYPKEFEKIFNELKVRSHMHQPYSGVKLLIAVGNSPQV
ncbi:MAG: hypothetical protein HOP24_01885 [Sideroxydans sp.]|nr:hypothetical protein [Sideroxydans sp.]